MATLVSSPPELCFSSNVADIVFRTDYPSGTVVLDIVAAGTRRNILTELVYADAEKNVTFGDLSTLLEGYARQHLQVTMECSFTDTEGTVSISPVTVLYALADVGTTASDFTTNHFLTILNGEKLTAIGRKEYLSAYNVTSVSVTASVLRSGAVTTVTGTLPYDSQAGTTLVYTFDVSPDNISTLLSLVSTDTLLSYEVSAGNRVQQFRVVTDEVPPAPSLIFANSFGCLEFLHCVGTHKKESKYDRQSTRIHGLMRNYRVTENRQFTANTGWLNTAMADWADDLFRSEEVLLWVENAEGLAVVITDSKSEISNEDDHRPAFEFTYTYAQRIHNVMQPLRAGRIFDNTFDRTFN